MGTEYELKYRGSPDTLAAIRAAFSGQWHTISMETTYYDTPTEAFSARRWTVRRRLENGVSVCTLKTPAGEAGRGEWETVCGSIDDALPELCRLGGIPLPDLSRGLLPICGAAFTRNAVNLEFPAFTCELALDQGLLLGGNRQQPLCEIEVELKSGSREALDAFGKQLKQTFGLEKEPKSKFRRALALAKGENHGTL